MDLAGEDACDKAKIAGLKKQFPSLNDCHLRLKQPPVLPNGQFVNVNDMPFY